MLQAHMNAMEDVLVANSKVAANTGHPLHKGNPRESFISEFLRNHLPSNISIGTGEIIDGNSKPNENRNQYDIVLYRNSYPKLDIGGGVHAFLAESVVATIEVKSTLSCEGIKQSVNAARNAKNLTPKFHEAFRAGYVPPKIINYVVAYDGPSKMQTVMDWINKSYEELSIPKESLPLPMEHRANTPSNSLDGVFILKSGFLYFDNVINGLAISAFREKDPNIRWVISDGEKNNLLMLFFFLQTSLMNTEGRWLDTSLYMQNSQFEKVSFFSVSSGFQCKY
ncbi:TPA: DUF6602 domain-containing protein [Yersinia enterocolitica]|nr:Uncharacterised protein [Yersinia kristensenii]